MAFALSGTTITQTGTDTDLSGLSGIAGVTELDGIYHLAGRNLKVEGILTIDPAVNSLSFDNAAPFPHVNLEGTLVLGSRTTALEGKVTDHTVATSSLTGPITYAKGVTIKSERSGGTFQNAVIASTNAAWTPSLYVFGGIIQTNAPLSILGTNSVNTNGFALIEDLDFYAENGSQCRIDSGDSATVNISGLRIVTEGVILVSRTYNSLSFELQRGAFQSFSGQTQGLRFDDVVFANNTATDGDLRANGGGQTLAFVNSDTASSTRLFGNTIACRFIFLSNANIQANDSSGSAVEGARYYIADTDDGNRFGPIGNTSDITSLVANMATSGSNVYSGSTDVNGEANETIILSTYNATTTTISDYSTGQTGSDDFVVSMIAYDKDISQKTPQLRGAGGALVDFILLDDALITESDKAITDAYTELETSAKFYDRAKAYLVDNYAGEKETIVSRTGDTIDAGSYDVELRSGGSNAFEFDGTTITVRVGTSFTGNITTTGTVTFQGSATINGGIIDANGDSFLAPVGIDSYTVHDTEADSNANLNPLGGGTGDEIFRFNFIAPRIYYVRAIAGGVVFQIQVSVVESGRTEISLSELAVLQSIKATTDSIKTRQATLNRNIQKGSLSIPATEELTNE